MIVRAITYLKNVVRFWLPFFRLVEEVKEQCNVELVNDDVYMATAYDEFVRTVVLKGRGLGGKKEFTYDAVCLHYDLVMLLRYICWYKMCCIVACVLISLILSV